MVTVGSLGGGPRPPSLRAPMARVTLARVPLVLARAQQQASVSDTHRSPRTLWLEPGSAVALPGL